MRDAQLAYASRYATGFTPHEAVMDTLSLRPGWERRCDGPGTAKELGDRPSAGESPILCDSRAFLGEGDVMHFRFNL
jgi:hypothetical protein